MAQVGQLRGASFLFLAIVCCASSAQAWSVCDSWFSFLCGSKTTTCPPKGFNAVSNFDLQEYISAPWYVQQMIPLIYQQQDDLNCVQAQYRLMVPDKPSAGLYVYNYANKGRVNGTVIGSNPTSQFQTVALADPAGNSKFLVGPESLGFAKFLAYGPYWVVAVGANYEWAVVSGGSPENPSNSACTTFLPLIPTNWQYKGGLWLFTRKPQDAVSAMAAKKEAQRLGFDTSQLVTVRQSGCQYPESYSSPSNIIPSDISSGPTLAAVIKAQGDLSTLGAAVEAVWGSAKGSALANVTILAPTDTAFKSFLNILKQKGVNINLRNLTSSSKSLLSDVLSLHVLPGRFAAADLRDGLVLSTLGSDTLTVDLKTKPGSVIFRVTSNDSKAIVIAADILVANGVIVHKIDAVLTAVVSGGV